jgi:hypothetical protein
MAGIARPDMVMFDQEKEKDAMAKRDHITVKGARRTLPFPFPFSGKLRPIYLHLPENPLCQTVRSRIQIKVGLEPQPEFRRRAKEAAQSQGGIRGDAAFAVDDFIDASR